MKFWIVTLSMLFSSAIIAQCDEFKMFNHFKIIDKNDMINYHVYAPGGLKNKKNVLIFIHGSNSKPFYEFFKKDGKRFRGSSVPFNLKTIPESYAFVIISKRGVVFCHDSSDEFEPSEEYSDNLSLNYRAQQVHKVIKDITLNYLSNAKKIVVIGHSEGSDVVAKLGTINKQITHIGFWSGSGNSQLYDFPLFIRKEVLEGKLTEEEGLAEIDSLLIKYKDIIEHKDALDKTWYGHPYKRWANFSEPPINNLLQISVPLYVAMGAKDTSVPVESTYLIPVEFIRNKKKNLTFKVYPNLDHSFNEKLKEGNIKRHWNNVFREFMNWVNLN